MKFSVILGVLLSLLTLTCFALAPAQGSATGGSGGGFGQMGGGGSDGVLVVTRGDFSVSVQSFDGKPPLLGEDIFVAPWEDRIQFVVAQEPFSRSNWIYFYRGDGTGFFIYDGNGQNPLASATHAFSHDYPDKSRYNPTLIWSDSGGVNTLGVLIYDSWKNDERPTPPLPSYQPELTGVQELDEVLITLALDNNDIWPCASGRANCICGLKTDNCRETAAENVHECNLSYSVCDENCD